MHQSQPIFTQLFGLLESHGVKSRKFAFHSMIYTKYLPKVVFSDLWYLSPFFTVSQEILEYVHWDTLASNYCAANPRYKIGIILQNYLLVPAC